MNETMVYDSYEHDDWTVANGMHITRDIIESICKHDIVVTGYKIIRDDPDIPSGYILVKVFYQYRDFDDDMEL